jgi:hypothetical protein
MNSLEMIRHCGFHQRAISYRTVCPVCRTDASYIIDSERDFVGRWKCLNGCLGFWFPVHEPLDAGDCPLVTLHQPATL